MLFDWFGAKKSRVQRSHGTRKGASLARAVSETLESRTLLSTVTATKLVFISQVPIIVDPVTPIATKTPNIDYFGIAVQLQNNTGQIPTVNGLPVAEQSVTLTLSSTTVANPMFSDGLTTETANVANAPTSPETTTAFFPNLQITVVGQYTLTATDAEGLQASTSIEVTKPSAVNSVIIVPQPAAVIGTLDNLYLQPEDAFGNPFTVPPGSVSFSVLTGTGTSRGTFGASTPGLFPYGTVETGFYGTTAGSPVEIDAKVDGVPVTSTLPTIEVNPGAASPTKSTVTVSQASVAAGDTDTVVFQAKDSNGNNLTTGGATVTFQTLSATGTSNGTFGATMDNGNGTYSAIFTGTTAGIPVKIEGIVNGAIVSTGMPTIKVIAGDLSAAQSTLVVAQSTIQTGQSDVVTFQARDAYSNALTSGGATVVFSIETASGTSNGTISTAADNGNGTYTATFIGTAVGTPIVISATVNGSPISTVLPTIQVIPSSASATQSVITVADAEIVAGSFDEVTLQAEDAAGNKLTSGGATIAFSVLTRVGTSGGFIGPVTDNDNGTYTATFTASTSGTPVQIDATVNGTQVTTILPTIVVTAGPIDPPNCTLSVSTIRVVTGQSAVVELQAKDSAGNDVPVGGATVAFSIVGTGTSVGTLGAVADNGDGTYSATFSAVTPGSAIQFAATVNGVAISSALPSLSVVAGAIDPSNSIITTSPIALGESATIILQLRDSSGNNVTTGADNVDFNLTGAVNQVIAGTFGGNGTYIGKFNAGALGNIQIGASINGASVPAIEATVPPVAVGFVFRTGFYYNPGRSLTLKIFNLATSLSVSGPFTVNFALSYSADGSNPIDVVGGGAKFNGKIGPNQSRVVTAKLGNFPSGFIPFANEAYLVASVTSPQYAADGVSTTPVLTPPSLDTFIHNNKVIHVHQGELVNIPVIAQNKGLTGPGLVQVFFSQLTLSGLENVYNGQGNGNGVQFKIQPLGPGLSLKIGSGGFNGKVAHAVGHLRFVVPAVVSKAVTVSAFYTDGIGSTLTPINICTLDIT